MDYCFIFFCDRLGFYVIIVWINGRSLRRGAMKSIISLLEENFDGENWLVPNFFFLFIFMFLETMVTV